jgi:sec-independent protein translocase protein TatA
MRAARPGNGDGGRIEMPGGWEWLIIIGVLVLLFGAKRLPEMARSVGQSARVFKGEMKGLRDDEGRNTTQAAPQSGARPTAPAEPAALPPVDRQVNGVPPAGATPAQPGEPVQRDPVRPETDR